MCDRACQSMTCQNSCNPHFPKSCVCTALNLMLRFCICNTSVQSDNFFSSEYRLQGYARPVSNCKQPRQAYTPNKASGCKAWKIAVECMTHMLEDCCTQAAWFDRVSSSCTDVRTTVHNDGSVHHDRKTIWMQLHCPSFVQLLCIMQQL